jgi:cytochrome d ubiquinol oxidase subunit II
VLFGMVIILPIILSYTALSYWVFRGKVRHGDEGYH